MDKFIVTGGSRLQGTVSISGAKNASLALMPATILAAGKFTLHNTPNNRDVNTFCSLLGQMGIESQLEGSTLQIDTRNINSHEAPYEYVKQMRASIYVLGPLVARFGEAKVSLPGGCNFGPRPVDLHLKGLEKLGAELSIESGYIHAVCKKLQGTHFHFDVSSVGATINLMMAAVLANGHTTFTNSAFEPEVIAVADMLVKMGAQISGIGTPTLEIDGVDSLSAVEFTTIPDRIEAGTYMIAAAMTKGDVTLTNVQPTHLAAEIQKLEASGATVTCTPDTIHVEMADDPNPVDITAAPYPAYPTDSQAQWAAYMLKCKGTATVHDTIYPTRFGYVPELQRLGGSIEGADGYAVVRGGAHLTGATVMSSDLRASASLVMAGLIAEGETEILRVYHLDRGYENMEAKLGGLGAKIERKPTEEF